MSPAGRAAIGLLVPASNRVMEGDFIGWTQADELALHTHRLHAPLQRPADMRDNLAALSDDVDGAARLLGLAAPDVVAFGCTSGSFLRGRDWDRTLRARIGAALGGVPMVTTASAVEDALSALGARRIALVSPYPPEVNDLMTAYLRAAGFEIAALESVDGWRQGNIANVSSERVLALGRDAARRGADACFFSCTNLRAAGLVRQLESEFPMPMVTANQATYWAALRALGRRHRQALLGRLGEGAHAPAAGAGGAPAVTAPAAHQAAGPPSSTRKRSTGEPR